MHSSFYPSTRQSPSELMNASESFRSLSSCRCTKNCAYSFMYKSRQFASTPMLIRLPSVRLKSRRVLKCSLPLPVNTQSRTFSANERMELLAKMLPFIQKIQNSIVVVKLSGSAMTDAPLKGQIINDLVLLAAIGVKPILVHGGSSHEVMWLTKLLNHFQSLEGRLAMDKDAIVEIIGMILSGKVNKSLVSQIHQAGGSATGLSGIDMKLMTARLNEDGNYSRVEISQIDSNVLQSVLHKGYIPVIAALAEDANGKTYQIDADLAAGEIAACVGAECLIIMSDIQDLLLDNINRNLKLNMRQLRKLREEGLVSKCGVFMVNCCLRSLVQGVGSIRIINDFDSHSLLLETLTEEISGILITPS